MEFLDGSSKVGGGVSIGTDQADFLKRHSAYIDAAIIIEKPDVHDYPARAHGRKRRFARLLSTDGIDDDFETRFTCRLRGWIDHTAGARAFDGLTPQRIRLGKVDLRRALVPEGQGSEQAHRSSSDYQRARFADGPVGGLCGEIHRNAGPSRLAR
jgi:hypothetical protein